MTAFVVWATAKPVLSVEEVEAVTCQPDLAKGSETDDNDRAEPVDDGAGTQEEEPS